MRPLTSPQVSVGPQNTLVVPISINVTIDFSGEGRNRQMGSRNFFLKIVIKPENSKHLKFALILQLPISSRVKQYS